VTFDIDANGILNVTAKDTATSKGPEDYDYVVFGTVEGRGRAHGEGKPMRMRPETRRSATRSRPKNQLDSIGLHVEKMLRDSGDKSRALDRGDVENAIADAKKALEVERQGTDGQGAGDSDQKVRTSWHEENVQGSAGDSGRGRSSGPLRRMERARVRAQTAADSRRKMKA